MRGFVLFFDNTVLTLLSLFHRIDNISCQQNQSKKNIQLHSTPPRTDTYTHSESEREIEWMRRQEMERHSDDESAASVEHIGVCIRMCVSVHNTRRESAQISLIHSLNRFNSNCERYNVFWNFVYVFEEIHSHLRAKARARSKERMSSERERTVFIFAVISPITHRHSI